MEVIDKEIQTNTMEQPTRKNKSFVFDPKWKKMNPCYSRKISKTSEIASTILDSMASHTVEEFYEFLYSKELVENIIYYSIEYAKQKNNHEFPLSSNELKVFIEFFYLVATVKSPTKTCIGRYSQTLVCQSFIML